MKLLSCSLLTFFFFTPFKSLKHNQRILCTWLVRLGVGKCPQCGVGGAGSQRSDVPVGRDCRGETFLGIICLQADELEGVNVGLETTRPGQRSEVFFFCFFFMVIFPH